MVFYFNNWGWVLDVNEILVFDYLDWEFFQGFVLCINFIDIVGDYNWYWYWCWGIVEIGNNVIYEFDIVCWVLQVKFLEEVWVNFVKNYYKDDFWMMYDIMYVMFKFLGGKVINWDGKS